MKKIAFPKKLKARSLSTAAITKIMYAFISLCVVAVVGYLGYFLYINLYQTIAQTEEIILLKQEVAPDALDTRQVEAVLEHLNQKVRSSQEINISAISNPFVPASGRGPTRLLNID